MALIHLLLFINGIIIKVMNLLVAVKSACYCCLYINPISTNFADYFIRFEIFLWEDGIVLLTVTGRLGFPGGPVVKNPLANAGDSSSIPGSGRSPREKSGNPLQYSCLENSMDRGAWRTRVHEVTEPGTTEQLNDNCNVREIGFSRILGEKVTES